MPTATASECCRITVGGSHQRIRYVLRLTASAGRSLSSIRSRVMAATVEAGETTI